jgi:hypothetical protein
MTHATGAIAPGQTPVTYDLNPLLRAARRGGAMFAPALGAITSERKSGQSPRRLAARRALKAASPARTMPNNHTVDPESGTDWI